MLFIVKHETRPSSLTVAQIRNESSSTSRAYMDMNMNTPYIDNYTRQASPIVRPIRLAIAGTVAARSESIFAGSHIFARSRRSCWTRTLPSPSTW